MPAQVATGRAAAAPRSTPDGHAYAGTFNGISSKLPTQASTLKLIARRTDANE
jgi:hypothetical protein